MTELALAEERTSSPGLDSQVNYARLVAAADMLPNAYRGKPANVLLAIGLGQSMGLSPAESLYRIAVIQGKPTASAELVAANVRKAGHRLRVTIEPGRAVCSIWRSDDPEFEFQVVRDAAWAQSMGLAGNDNYKKQGDTMLSWRAITACARLACPEALYGVAYTPDEMYDMDKRPAQTHVEQVAPEPSDPDPGGATPVEPEAVPSSPEGEPSGSEPFLLSNRTKFGRMFYARMSERPFASDQERIEYLSETVGRLVTSSKELTEDEARKVLARLDEEDGIEEAEVSA